MPMIGVQHNDQLYKWNEIPRELVPPELIMMMNHDDRADGLHLSTLTICPYRIIRERYQDYYISLEILHKMTRGKMYDYMAERHKREGEVYYQRTFRGKINGYDVVGHPDIVDVTNLELDDYKAPSKTPKGNTFGYEAQVNGYRLLVEPELGIEIKKLYINYCGPVSIVRLPVPVWDYQQTMDFFEASLEKLLEVEAKMELRACKDTLCFICKQKVEWIT